MDKTNTVPSSTVLFQEIETFNKHSKNYIITIVKNAMQGKNWCFGTTQQKGLIQSRLHRRKRTTQGREGGREGERAFRETNRPVSLSLGRSTSGTGTACDSYLCPAPMRCLTNASCWILSSLSAIRRVSAYSSGRKVVLGG